VDGRRRAAEVVGVWKGQEGARRGQEGARRVRRGWKEGANEKEKKNKTRKKKLIPHFLPKANELFSFFFFSFILSICSQFRFRRSCWLLSRRET